MLVFTRSVGLSVLPHGPYTLLVDDEIQSVGPLGELIKLAAFASVPARSTTDALACCHHRRPEVLVTDLVMPGPDGRALDRRARRRHPLLPIVLVTGQNLDDPERAIPSDLFVAVFPKPLDFDRFLTFLAKLMNRRAATGRRWPELDRPRLPR